MSDERTTEQRQADDALAAAVRDVAEAYASDDCRGWVVTDYVVVYATQGWDDDGDSCTAVGTAVDGGTVPLHRQLGLVEYAAARYRKAIVTDD